MAALLIFIAYLIYLYTIILGAAVLLQLLIQLSVIPYTPMVRSIYQGLYAVTEPALAPIRRRLPRTNNLDFSPLVLILILMIVEGLLRKLAGSF